MRQKEREMAKEVGPFFEGKQEKAKVEATPTKIGVHAQYINPYLHKFFKPILFD